MSRSLAILSALLLASAALAQKPPLKPEEYKQWQTLQAAQISNDGRWITYQVSLVDGDGVLVLKNSDGPQGAAIPVGSSATFSADSKWLAFMIAPPKAVQDRLREEKKPIENKLGLRNLETGKDQLFDGVQRFRMTRDGKTVLAHRYRGQEKKEGGSDLLVIDLGGQDTLTIGNVTEAEPNRQGNLIALQIESDSGHKGVQVLDRRDNSLKTLHWGRESIAGLTWAPKADVLGFLVGRKDERKEGDAFTPVIAANLTGEPALKRFETAGRAGFPEGYRVAEWRGLRLNPTGTAAAFGIAEWKDKRRPIRPDDRATVEVWNWRDIRTVPEQRRSLQRDGQRSDLVVWRLDEDAFRVVRDADGRSLSLAPNMDRVLIQDATPYLAASTNGIGYRDVTLLDVRDGTEKKVVTKLRWTLAPSPKGRYLAFYDKKQWHLYDAETGRTANLTGVAKVSFENEENDYTIPEKPPVGFPIWLKGDTGVILFDRYDAWLAKPGSEIRRLTDGRKDRVRYRFEDVGDSEEGPDPSRPLFFTAFDERTKASGFFRLDPDGKGKLLSMDNARLYNLVRSKGTDRLIFQMSTFEKPGDLYLTNLDFAAIKPESKLNPQQANYAWGKAELVDFKSRWGKELQGVLIYPAEYVPGRKYPMITYVYERLSDGLHSYVAPAEHSSYNAQALSQQGYFVFMPDIAYKGRTPGQNAVDCLEPAVAAVLAKNVGVDPERIGLMGHSWGGYQTAFVTSVSKVFKAGVAGAPLTDLTSMYNTFYWNSGTSNQVLLETGQGRLEVPFWEDPKTYFDNSPVWQSAKRTAPILIAHGDQDGAVDYHQGVALYQTLRRMGKPCVLLLYQGENHGFAKKANQLDYACRLRHFFDVHLKGAKPERWLSEGLPLTEQAAGSSSS